VPPRKKGHTPAASVIQTPAPTSLPLPPATISRHVVVGDLHLRRTDPLGVIEPDGLNSRLKDKLEALKYAITFALENQATHIDLLGDAFEALNPPEKLKELFWEILDPVIQKGLQITIIIGNHDTTGELYNFSGDKVIAPKNVNIVYKQGLKLTLSDTQYALYLPYLHREQLLQEYETLVAKFGTPTVIFGHFEIAGAELAPDNTKIREGIDRAVFNDVPSVLLGHIHKFQEFRPGFAYIGSSIKCDFGEVNNRKVFGVLDVLPTGPIVQYIDIPQRPMYQIPIMESNPENLYLATKLPDCLLQPGVLIKFILEGSAEWLGALDKQRFKRRFPQALRVVFEDKKWDTDRQKTEVVTSNIMDRIHEHTKAKNKGKEYLDAGILIGKEVQEIDL